MFSKPGGRTLFLTEEILTHLNEGLTAILVRTNRMAEQVAEACFRRQIPYQMREKKQDFMHRSVSWKFCP